MLTPAQKTLFDLVNQEAVSQGLSVYVVGGVVRDLLMGANALDEDIDLMVGGDAAEFAQIFNQRALGKLTLFPRYLTAKIQNPKQLPGIQELDFASARTETYSTPGALPSVKLAAVEADLGRRDFSINAMALNINVFTASQGSGLLPQELEKVVLDPFGGCADLQARCVRVLHDSSFLDDPTRIFRAARYTTRLGATLHADTLPLLREAVVGGAIGALSLPRIGVELRKVSAETKWWSAIQILCDWGVTQACAALGGVKPETVVSMSAPSEAAQTPEERILLLALLSRSTQSYEEWLAQWTTMGLGKRRLLALKELFESADAQQQVQRNDYSLFLQTVKQVATKTA